MTKHSTAAIGIQALAPISEVDLSDLFSQLTDKGISYKFEQRRPSPYAAMEWLIPTGIVLFITHSYFDGIFKELGKDHYQWFKSATSSLYKKMLGKNPEYAFSITRERSPKAPSKFSGALSFVYINKQGYRVKLMFPLDITAEDYALSCSEFMKLVANHEAKLTNDPIEAEIASRAKQKAALAGDNVAIEDMRQTISILVFWNRHDKCFHVADPIASSQAGKLVSQAIGHPLGDY